MQTQLDPLNIYIGFDSREPEASRIAESSLMRHTKSPVQVTLLDSERLASSGLLRRLTDTRGQMYDLYSNAPCSTSFAISRFLVPILAQEGFALFVDADVVFLADVAKLFALADPTKAVMVVQHQLVELSGTKMDGQQQSSYARKNESSVCLWNCDHPANRRLSLQDVNERPGRDLHRFYWLNECEIGYLPGAWNWLVGVEPKPEKPLIAHFTLGGPFTSGWPGAEHDDLWNEAARAA